MWSSKNRRLKKKALTLIEVLTVAIIIGILAISALPLFTKTLETTRAKEAQVALRQIRTGQRIYRTGEEFYYPHYTDHPAAEINTATINRDLRLFLDARIKRNWSYSVDANTSDTFSATATRTGSGRNSGEQITIDQDGNLAGTWSP